MRGDGMEMVMLGSLSLNNQSGIAAMRRKLLAVAERLGLNPSRAVRLAAAASDHAKDAIRTGTLELRIALAGAGTTPELCVDFISVAGPDNFLQVGFDRVEKLIDRKVHGWRACCEVDLKALADSEITGCQAVIAEQNVEELVEALHVLVERYRHSRDTRAT